MKLIYDLWLAKLRTADADCPPIPAENEGLFPPFEPDAEPVGGAIRYVTPGGGGNGSSWANASGDLQSMISASSGGDRIYVMAGNYSLTANIIPKVGVSVYCGFNADKPEWATRNPFKNPSVFDAGFRNLGFVNTAADFSAGQIVDGITITNHVCAASNAGAFYGNKKTTLKHCSALKSYYSYSSTNGDFCGSNFTQINCMSSGCIDDYTSAVNVSNSTLRGCIVTDSITGTSNVVICCGITVDNSNAEQCLVINCHNRGTTVGGSTGISAKNKSQLSGCVVANSLSYYGVGITANTGAVTNCLVINCGSTMGSAVSDGIFCGFGGAAVVCNCLVANCKSGSTSAYSYILNVPAACNSEATALKFCNNAAIGNSTAGCYVSGANYFSKIRNCTFETPIAFNTNAAVNCDRQNVTEDAAVAGCKFVDPGRTKVGYMNYDTISGDFHIIADSILAEVGHWESGVTPATDFDGKERGESNISIGPFETGKE